MRERDFKWVTDRVAVICANHSYDHDQVQLMFNLIDSDVGVPKIRTMLTGLIADHHYELVAFFAEFLLKDDRVTYRALGKTFTNKCAKAPGESPAFLRLRDRANAGLSCFKAKVVVSNPWARGATQTRLLKLFAATEGEAVEMARSQGQSLILGGRIVDLQVCNIADDDDADKADVVRILLRPDGGSLSQVAVTSFAAANSVLKNWMNSLLPSDGLITTAIEVEWENSARYRFIIAIGAKKALKGIDIPALIKEHIDFVVDDVLYADRSANENARFMAEMRAIGAFEHCAHIRATCLLSDRVPLSSHFKKVSGNPL